MGYFHIGQGKGEGGTGGNEGVPIGPAIIENVAMPAMTITVTQKIVLEDVA